jgi:tRNA(Ile)-lysidine synthetase-like protein
MLASDFVKEWFANEHWWFGCDSNVDTYLKEKYINLLDNVEQQISSIVEKIIVYDQLPRHCYRNEQASHIIEFFLQKALSLSLTISDFNVFTDNELCFVLLPWRHSKKNELIYHALEIIWNRLETLGSSKVLIRFIRATYNRMPLEGPCLQRLQISNSHFKSEILDNNPCDLPIYKNFIEKKPIENIVVSLSGGVDSMICSWVLSRMYPNSVTAIHVNYNNRDVSDEESQFVVWWCTKIGIPCYVRKLHEIRREPCMKYGLRSTYESYTRQVRFHCYKSLLSTKKNCVVVLGHNKDDILENIFTNIAHKSKYENLNGMTEFSNQDNITFWRPLLDKIKKEIYEYAYLNNIPFLPPSTPNWSHRGRIRSTVVPSLNLWDEGFVPGLYAMSNHMRDLINLTTAYIDQILYQENIILPNLDKLSMIFWKMFLNKLGIFPSDKCIKEICERLQGWTKAQDFKIPLTKDKTMIICAKTNLVKII